MTLFFDSFVTVSNIYNANISLSIEYKIKYVNMKGTNKSRVGADIETYLSQPTNRLGGNRKRSLQSTNTNQKSLETVFSTAICRPVGRQMAIDISTSNYL